MESKRFFVGNLPNGSTEDDLRKIFSSYGKIEKVEVKTKENLVDPENPKLLAFVTLGINEHRVDQCINEVSQAKVRGNYLSVSVAKESFLERLKRERGEGGKNEVEKEQQSNGSIAPIQIAIPQKHKNSEFAGVSNKSIKFDIDDEGETGDLDEDSQVVYQSITRKNARNSLQNGKIKIQSVASEPIHVINNKQKPLKRLDEKSQKADQKRKQSQNKMKNQYNQQKLAIQQALSAVDNKSKKIVFDDDDQEMNENQTGNSKKYALFDEDGEEDEDGGNDFAINEQFEGEEGAELIKLQSKLNLDPRFKLDGKFVENQNKDKKKEKNDGIDERKWQMDIIERVVGRKLDSGVEAPSSKKKTLKPMLRFDPTKEEHQKFTVAPVEEEQEEKQVAQRAEVESVMEEDLPEVSKEVFYTVSDDLKSSLKRRGDGFSLLSMFGRAADEASDAENEGKEYNEKILISKGDRRGPENPFTFDSSDSENEDGHEAPAVVTSEKGKSTTKSGVWKENFFFVENDSRLKEGINFFKSTAKPTDGDEPEESYDKIKDKLRLIIKQKISKSKKNLQKTKSKFRNKDRKLKRAK